MNTEISALLVYGDAQAFQHLKTALRVPGMRLREARTCAQACRRISGANPPGLVFTDTCLPDGDWCEIVRAAQAARAPINVIVVSRLVDIPLYIRAIEQGAFDYITPPFEPFDLAYVIRCAASNLLERKEAAAHAQESPQRALPSPALQPQH